MRVLDIVPGTTVDGPGLRTSIYFAGCSHHCKGCHNPQSWDPSGGKDMSIDEIMEVVDYNGFDVTFSGGDPIYQIEELLKLAARLKAEGYGIWCYTGYVYEDVASHPLMSRLLEFCDVLVDGKFDQSLKDVGLLFRGSSNQRLVDLRRSRPGDVKEWTPEPLIF